MTFITKPSALLVAALIGLAVTPALAVEAYIVRDADVYKSASASSKVVNSVETGDHVDVKSCAGDYCLITISGPDGYVKKSRLGAIQSGKPNSKVPFSFGLNIGPDGKPSISIGVGTPDQPKLKIKEADEVCFYAGSGFNGSSFCAEPGDSDDSLSGQWDDNISSIDVSGEAEVTVCSEEDLEGICATITSPKSSLPGALNNEISSYEVN